MGICGSSHQLDPETPSTAKVIHQDGLLQEFNYPVIVSHIINPRESFICNSDEMEFDDFLSPVSADSKLQLGQLYFAFPVSRLNQPLPAEEMAALAVMAYQVLMKYGGGKSTEKCGCRSNTTSGRDEGKIGERESNVVVCRKKKGVTRKNRRKVFAANLSKIEE